MQQFAALLMIFGFGSMGLELIGMHFRILGWIDMWGPTIAWAIRGALAAAGVVLFLIARRQESSPAEK